MYETFGFSRSASNEQSISLFIPDNTIDPAQYVRGGASNIASVSILGDWDPGNLIPMRLTAHPGGYLYIYDFDPPLPDGWYQYQYLVEFQDATVRMVGDPCTKYGGDANDRSAFVVGGTVADPEPIANRLPSNDLIIYELMIDDFTREYRGAGAPVDAIRNKLDLVQSLNINAIEFMPWISWPDDTNFSWGYDPAYFFSVESSYVAAPGNPLERLSRLANLITDCHRRGIHVLLDIVLQHARQGAATNGFPYYWLWQNPLESPFVGQFVGSSNFGMLPLDYGNGCTQQFVTDVCKYWLRKFKLDGFRFDQVTGYDNTRFPKEGAPELIADLKQFAVDEGLRNISLILEDDWGYQVVADSNFIQPTGAWFDVFRSAVKGGIDTSYMRVLNSAFQFDAPICPTIYLENHDHATLTSALGSRDRWYKTQPYMIALATCSGAVLLHNGQEWGQLENLWEDDSNAPPEFKRVQSRPLTWAQRDDDAGQRLVGLYSFLMGLRAAHPALRSPNFYPDTYDQSWTRFSPDGYGIDESRQVAIYHRWDGGDLYMVVLNFSDSTQWVDIPLPRNGVWTDLLNANRGITVDNYLLGNFPVSSNWGCILHLP